MKILPDETEGNAKRVIARSRRMSPSQRKKKTKKEAVFRKDKEQMRRRREKKRTRLKGGTHLIIKNKKS